MDDGVEHSVPCMLSRATCAICHMTCAVPCCVVLCCDVAITCLEVVRMLARCVVVWCGVLEGYRGSFSGVLVRHAASAVDETATKDVDLSGGVFVTLSSCETCGVLLIVYFRRQYVVLFLFVSSVLRFHRGVFTAPATSRNLYRKCYCSVLFWLVKDCLDRIIWPLRRVTVGHCARIAFVLRDQHDRSRTVHEDMLKQMRRHLEDTCSLDVIKLTTHQSMVGRKLPCHMD